MKARLNTLFLILIVMALNIGLDQSTKSYARTHFKHKGTIPVIGRLFVIRYAENRGAFLGTGSDLPAPWRMILLKVVPTLILAAAFFYVVFYKNFTLFQYICIASILGGGVSNIYDRIFYDGKVTDFLNFGIGNHFRTGILNLADLSITFGAVLLIILELARSKKTDPSKNPA